MPTEQEWHDRLRAALDERIRRQDVALALRVEADPNYAFDDFDIEEFGNWAADWVDFTVESTAGPVMPGTAETEWVVGENDDVRVSLLLSKR